MSFKTIEKSFTVKIRQNSGDEIVIDDLLSGGALSWSWKIGGAPGSISLELVGSICDDRVLHSSTNPFFKEDNFIEIYRQSDENPLGRLVYQGYITKREGFVEPNREGIRLEAKGITHLLTWCLNLTTTAAGTSGDAADMIKSLFDGASGLPITFDTTMVNTSGTGSAGGVEYTDNTILADIKKAEVFLPENWYMVVQPDGKVIVDMYNDANPDLLLSVGREIKDFRIGRTRDQLCNYVVLNWVETVDFYFTTLEPIQPGENSWSPADATLPCPTNNGDTWYVTQDGTFSDGTQSRTLREGERIVASYNLTSADCPTDWGDFSITPRQYDTAIESREKKRQTVYQDAASIAQYGKRMKKVESASVSNLAEAEAYAESLVVRNNEPKYQGQITLNSCEDLETIRPGMTLRIQNLETPNGSLPPDHTLRITAISYSEHFAVITVEDEFDLIDEIRNAINT